MITDDNGRLLSAPLFPEGLAIVRPFAAAPPAMEHFELV
jgi:hypothetical protein